jgi:hypothetical protein
MRRIFALAPSTIALIVVALIVVALPVRSAGIAVSFAGEGNTTLAPAHEPALVAVNRADGRATEPDVPARARFLHAKATPTGRVHAPRANPADGARSTVALAVDRASLELTAHRDPCASVDARQNGVAAPGQPAPASRAPPIG